METWIDVKNKLEWQKDNLVDPMNWYEAMEYAKSLGYGWRVPSLEELETLLDRSKYNPAMREEVPFRDSFECWSSFIHANDDNHAWYVSFFDGYVSSYYKDCRFYVCYVRDAA